MIRFSPLICTSALLFLRGCHSVDLPDTCSSNVFCKGPLLHAVQTARIFRDSKTFVDMRMIQSENDTVAAFERFTAANPNASKDQLKRFVDEHFTEDRGFVNWTLPDYNPEPQVLAKIQDPTFKQFARDLIAIWPKLSRKVGAEVEQYPDRFSTVSLPNAFIVPGGRFTEIYYWDSYWIIEGLIINEMLDTARGMIENMLYLVRKFGHVPNGSRVYYSQRSQPPLLTSMAARYLQATSDLEWLRRNLGTIENELRFWSEHRAVVVEKNGKNHTLLRYNAPSKGPRPESYYEDHRLAEAMETDERRQQFYTDLKSAAESGWDFSARWFVAANGSDRGNLSDIHTTRIIPVDLNAIYASALETVGNFYNLFDDRLSARSWWLLAESWRQSIDEVLWDDADGTWYDYDMVSKAPRRYFHPSNLAPAWKKCVETDKLSAYAPKIMAYLNATGALDYPGGVPTSVERTGEQWDFPNAWPPLQSMVVIALRNLATQESLAKARDLAELWVRVNHKGFRKYEAMFEKYDAELAGEYGGGGEYAVQSGFGWTNGVVLEFLEMYGDVIQDWA